MRQILADPIYPALAELLESPSEDFDRHLYAALRLANTTDLKLAARLHSLQRELESIGERERAELHASTFELSPACVLYVSVHIFGEESFKRAKLMTGLDEAYHAAGFDRGGELPDHLGVILRCASAFGDEEWSDLMRLCLVASSAKMSASLARTSNPYRHLLAGIHGLLEQQTAREGCHA